MALPTFVTGRDPFFSGLDEALDRAFGRFAGDLMPFNTTTGSQAGAMTPWRSLGGTFPQLDVVELPDKFQVKADAPGFTPDEISVHITEDGSALHISGRKEEKTETKEEGKYWRSERRLQSFSRSLALPPNAVKDDKAISASLENGVLNIEIPKAPEQPQPEPKRIPIKSGSDK